MHPVPPAIILAGIVLIMAAWLANRPSPEMAPGPAAEDWWQTPFYLRSNTPIFDGSTAVVPSVPDDSYFALQGWALPTFYAGALGG